jgi:Zn-dependent protease with chaperone function
MTNIFASLLTLGALFSMALGVFFLILQQFEVYDWRVTIGLTIGFSVLVFLISPLINDWLLKWVNDLAWLDHESFVKKDPHGYALLQKLCVTYHVPMPRIGIIPDRNPTAFTYGCFQSNARIVLTEGMYEFLTPEQRSAVIAHEFGHIYHYDFAIMSGASLLVTLMYQCAEMAQHRMKKSGSGNKEDKSGYIALFAYLCYYLSIYLLLFLSRTREYQADRFAARHTSAGDLAGALVRIAYGIVAIEDTDTSHRLMTMTRALGAVDIRNARGLGAVLQQSHAGEANVARAMMFDLYSPWSWLLELNSTHPLTGRRLSYLNDLAIEFGQYYPNFRSHIAAFAKELNHVNLRQDFFTDLGMLVMPWVVGLAVGYLFQSWIYGGLIFLLSSLTIKLTYMFPKSSPPMNLPATTLDLMSDPSHSPVRGYPVAFSGTLIGRADPGNKFSPDVVLQDNTGLIPLNYQSVWGMFGDVYQGFFKTAKNLQEPVKGHGWFFRTIGGQIMAEDFTTKHGQFRSNIHAGYTLHYGLGMGLARAHST